MCEPFSALLSRVVHVAVHSTIHFSVPLTSYLFILQTCLISVCATCPFKCVTHHSCSEHLFQSFHHQNIRGDAFTLTLSLAFAQALLNGNAVDNTIDMSP